MVRPKLTRPLRSAAAPLEERRLVDVQLRLLDIVLSATLLLLFLPVILIAAAAILLTSGRPILYRGERVGRGGRVFTMVKFRTLQADAEQRLGPYLGAELVARTSTETTTVGRLLRASQLDEIPQLWNIFRGDMSFVGPRPIRPRFFEELATQIPAYWQRLVVRPGLSGLAQIRKEYETPWAEKLADDLEYIADRSVRLYLRTVVGTGWRVLRQTVLALAKPVGGAHVGELVSRQRVLIAESRRQLVDGISATQTRRHIRER